MSKKLFVIKDDNSIIKLYDDLEKAKSELKDIYNKTFDFKYYSYEIIVYELVDNEYVKTNVSYIYQYDNHKFKNGI